MIRTLLLAVLALALAGATQFSSSQAAAPGISPLDASEIRYSYEKLRSEFYRKTDPQAIADGARSEMGHQSRAASVSVTRSVSTSAHASTSAWSVASPTSQRRPPSRSRAAAGSALTSTGGRVRAIAVHGASTGWNNVVMAEEIPQPLPDDDLPPAGDEPPDESTLLGKSGVEEEVLAELARAEAELEKPSADDEDDGAVV